MPDPDRTVAVAGGRIVIDDYYAWSGCRRAVDDYFQGRDGFRLLQPGEASRDQGLRSAHDEAPARSPSADGGPRPSRPGRVAIQRGRVAKVVAALRAGTPEAVAAAVATGQSRPRIATPTWARWRVASWSPATPPGPSPGRRGSPPRHRRPHRPSAHAELSTIRRWTHPAVLAGPAGRRPLGVFDYRQPDRARASKNIGDYVQTLALLGNFARFTDVEFSGVDGLGELAAELQSRVRPDLRVELRAHRVHLVPVSRDFSAGDPIPRAPGCWPSGGTCTRRTASATGCRTTPTAPAVRVVPPQHTWVCSTSPRGLSAEVTARSAAVTGRRSTCC